MKEVTITIKGSNESVDKMLALLLFAENRPEPKKTLEFEVYADKDSKFAIETDIKRLLADPKNKSIDDYYEQLCNLESQAQEVRICLE